ncbi:MAG TPA: hypothetical protein VNW50_19925, partial [Streptosporangiaceae bacterium]|nr:hypothetical protein [Streptosporangiaceae bacterium]
MTGRPKQPISEQPAATGAGQSNRLRAAVRRLWRAGGAGTGEHEAPAQPEAAPRPEAAAGAQPAAGPA